jgi:4-hydroxy-tetrahydrodipicolinate synthase
MSAALGAFKAALVARGVIAHPYTQAPLLPLTGTEARTVAERIAAAGLGPIG